MFAAAVASSVGVPERLARPPTDGITSCDGSNGFDVTAHVTTSTMVALDCHEPSRDKDL